MKFETWQIFVLATVLSWGVYVPVLHYGQSKMGGGNPGNGSLRAYLCVGVAYLFIAIAIPVVLLKFNPAGSAGNESLSFATKTGEFNTGGVAFSILGGVAGAFGALGIILALKNGGHPRWVIPLVFAGAPIVGSIVALIWHPPKGGNPEAMRGWILFGAGILMAAAGAALVLYSKSLIEAKPRPALAQAVIAPADETPT